MSFNRFRYRITTPHGRVLDVTERVVSGGLGSITEDTDESLLQLTHSDVTVVFRNNDGYFTELFGNARPGDVFDVTIDELIDAGRRRRWTRIFGGLPDFPWSVETDDYEKTISITCYSYTKLLEYYSATDYRRTFPTMTGTAVLDSVSLTISPSTSLLAVNDKVTLTTAETSETKTISNIDSGTTVTVKEKFEHDFTSALLTVETPYFRNLTVQQIATDLFARCGINKVRIDLSSELADLPFPTPLNSKGLPLGAPASILEKSDNLTVYQGGHRFITTSPGDNFTDAGTDTPRQDWRPQLTTEPGTLLTIGEGVKDYVHSDHHIYSVDEVVTETEHELWLYRNGLQFKKIHTNVRGYTHDEIMWSYDVAAPWGEVWVSFYANWDINRSMSDAPHVVEIYRTRTVRIRMSDAAIAGSFQPFLDLQFSAAADRMLGARVADFPAGQPGFRYIIQYPEIQLYDHGVMKQTLEVSHDRAIMRTLRHFMHYFAVLTEVGSALLWDDTTGKLVANYHIANSSAGAVATTFQGIFETEEYDGYCGGVWFSISTRVSGVIPYANFADMSVAEALKQISLVSAAVLLVTEHRTGLIISRERAIIGKTPIKLETPLRNKFRPVWENYRNSVELNGEDENGETYTRVLGNTGDTSHRLTVDVGLVVSDGLVSAIGTAYLRWLGKVRRQHNGIWRQPLSGHIRMFQRVLLSGAVYRVLRAETNKPALQQSLLLIEEV